MPHLLKQSAICLLLLSAFATVGFAEVTPWQTTLAANLGIAQSQYSNNWQGGSASGFAWVANLNTSAQKQISKSFNWTNTLKLAFGQTHNQDLATKKWLLPLKSTDLIDFETILRLTRGWWVDPFIGGRIETQFLDLSEPSQTRNLDPMRISETVGGSRTLAKSEKSEWSARLGVGLRQYINQDFRDAAHVNPYRLSTNDGGIQFDSDYHTPLNDRINLTSKLNVFQALFNSKSKELKGLPNENYWRAVDVNWESTLTGHLAEFLAVNLDVQFLYDKEVTLGGRFKQTLTLGLTYIMKS